MHKYDIAIIGSGLGGLICGLILSREGYKVCIVEKNDQLGGCLQSFKRDGMEFDTGVHYIGAFDEGQVLNKCFKFLNLDKKIKYRKMDENGFDRICLQGKEYNYAMGKERFCSNLIKHFPEESSSINNYFKTIKDVVSNFPLYNLTIDLSPVNNLYFTTSVGSFIENITKNETLQKVLAGTNLLYGGEKNKSPMYLHSLINYSYIESAYRIVGRSSQIADLLAEEIKKNSGEISNKSEVTELLFDENKKISGLKIKGSRLEIFADYFISNTHPRATLKMIKKGMVREVYRKRLNSLKNTVSFFSLYIVLKENCFRFLNHNVHFYNEDNVWVQDSYSNAKWPESYFLCTPPHSINDKYAKTVSVLCYMKYDEVKAWEKTLPGQRGDDYLDFKRKKAEKVFNVLERKFPGLKNSIKSYTTSTPLTYRDYIGTEQGSAYGYLKECTNFMLSHVSPRTKIPNLYFTGQNVSKSGVLGVTMGAIHTCSYFVGLDYLIKKINGI